MKLLGERKNIIIFFFVYNGEIEVKSNKDLRSTQKKFNYKCNEIYCSTNLIIRNNGKGSFYVLSLIHQQIVLVIEMKGKVRKLYT